MNNINPYRHWTAFTPVVPDIYKDAISPQQQIHDMCCAIHKLIKYVDMLGDNINIDRETIELLKENFDKFMESGFDDFYKAQLEEWIRDHFGEVIQSVLNQGVFFGLTDSGYFCANVAYQLAFILDTIADYSDENYGRLTITY